MALQFSVSFAVPSISASATAVLKPDAVRQRLSKFHAGGTPSGSPYLGDMFDEHLRSAACAEKLQPLIEVVASPNATTRTVDIAVGLALTGIDILLPPLIHLRMLIHTTCLASA